MMTNSKTKYWYSNILSPTLFPALGLLLLAVISVNLNPIIAEARDTFKEINDSYALSHITYYFDNLVWVVALSGFMQSQMFIHSKKTRSTKKSWVTLILSMIFILALNFSYTPVKVEDFKGEGVFSGTDTSSDQVTILHGDLEDIQKLDVPKGIEVNTINNLKLGDEYRYEYHWRMHNGKVISPEKRSFTYHATLYKD